LHRQSPGDKIVFSYEIQQTEALQKELGNRAIGVVYDPSNERGNYVPSFIPKRYDAFVFIDQTTALHPIDGLQARNNEPPDTYPSGF
jgi:erythromycin esterase